ncbi:hypothetical protein NO559_14810 [Dasania sp. GY-MA-18]|uniref:Uncharacterized protein n=1 Tax=Dasania phycosphaerae TaxID=2950436 RepID=A0A9J6RQQ2_9GAMM|nr:MULTISPECIES: hypothetical protein [Dasania]MCR8924052.1 hypothetical protein [Dasania sp. GY-MA-18]MCZ0866625.1 hypothetical protein [Dasania phycosphaerae]MCZ0870210.1 hypothetical protein [Dasania phycosphaerae]
MSIGTWSADPAASQSITMSEQLLQSFIALTEQQQLDDLSQQLSAQEQADYALLMRQNLAFWQPHVQELSDAEIIALMKFFTKAEQLPGWDAGDQSPVIALGKILKQRGTGINKELSLWIKANSNNRFLPHGSLL